MKQVAACLMAHNKVAKPTGRWQQSGNAEKRFTNHAINLKEFV